MRSLRSRLLLLIGGALIPLAVVGVWLNRSAERSAEELLRARRDAAFADAPFENAERKGLVVIGAVTLATIGIAALLTRRITHSLEDLAAATHAVAAGDLDRRVSERSASEAGQVGRAFNTMTRSLRDTLRQLSQREALVAVGEFAASLAHEVRNPLTSIRIDLQRVEEVLPGESPLRVPLGRALREVERLDQTVSGALRIARAGSIALKVVDLNIPLQVRGDDAALEQLFLNILLNAAQALGPDGKAGVTVVTQEGNVQVDIWDSGAGMAADQLEKVFDPFFSTKRDGTGLGLSVVRQIVNAHGGFISVDSAVDAGTTVSIRLSLVG